MIKNLISIQKYLAGLIIITCLHACSVTKNIDAPINTAGVERIITTLASDNMQGRRTGTPSIEKAADFIANEFRAAGLQPVSGNSYKQEFVMIKPKQTALTATVNQQQVPSTNVVVVTANQNLAVNQSSGYTVEKINKGDNFNAKAQSFAHSGRNVLVVVDTSFKTNFSRLGFLKRQFFRTNGNTIFLLSNEVPQQYEIQATHEIEEVKMANVVGVLPGKSRPNEYVIFSGHYDHIGIGKPVNGDSIYNGANDNAAGTTAVIMLANHFKKLNNNERTLVFAAFTAEEIGGFGSQYFSKQYDPLQVKAMFNIEMIGTESKWGKNSAFITGYEVTDMGNIMQKNLEGTGFTFHPDPYPQQQLFYRSDNATLAKLGVPAHTISTAKMENEPHYHKPSDEVPTLDLQNMTQIIQAIALSAKSIISGDDTPSRVKTESLR